MYPFVYCASDINAPSSLLNAANRKGGYCCYFISNVIFSPPPPLLFVILCVIDGFHHLLGLQSLRALFCS